MTTNPMPHEYDFTLVLDGVEQITPEVEDALFEAGCDDGTLSRRYGRLFLTFTRQAPSLKDAIISAIKQVRASNIGARVLRVDACDMVTQAEIARRIGRTRQIVSQYIKGGRGPGNFPPPACNITDGAPLWYWCEVAHWLCDNSILKEADFREAQDLTVINSVLELEHQQQIAPESTRQIMAELGPC